jgi:hypothetical protein
MVARLPGLQSQLGPDLAGRSELSFGRGGSWLSAATCASCRPMVGRGRRRCWMETEHELFERYAAAAHPEESAVPMRAASRSWSRTDSAPYGWPISSSFDGSRRPGGQPRN